MCMKLYQYISVHVCMHIAQSAQSQVHNDNNLPKRSIIIIIIAVLSLNFENEITLIQCI